jgi:hypothetical protein
VWPESHATIEKNLAAIPARVRRKITFENVCRLYDLPQGKDAR